MTPKVHLPTRYWSKVPADQRKVAEGKSGFRSRARRMTTAKEADIFSVRTLMLELVCRYATRDSGTTRMLKTSAIRRERSQSSHPCAPACSARVR